MEPNIWGPGAWTFLHSITLNYPNNPNIQTKKIYKDFFYILSKILPCSVCKKNYKLHFNKNPINFHLNNKESLVKWLINIHNETNKSNKKPVINYKQFLKIYNNLYKNKNESITYYKNKNQIQKYVIYFLIIIIIIILIFVKIKFYI